MWKSAHFVYLFMSVQQVLEAWQILLGKMVAADFCKTVSDSKPCVRWEFLLPCFCIWLLLYHGEFFLLLNLVPDDHSKLFSVGPLHVVLSWQKLLSEEQKPGCTENVSLTARCRSLVQPRVCCWAQTFLQWPARSPAARISETREGGLCKTAHFWMYFVDGTGTLGPKRSTRYHNRFAFFLLWYGVLTGQTWMVRIKVRVEHRACCCLFPNSHTKR